MIAGRSPGASDAAAPEIGGCGGEAPTSRWPYGGMDLRAATARSSPFCRLASPAASSDCSLAMCAS